MAPSSRPRASHSPPSTRSTAEGLGAPEAPTSPWADVAHPAPPGAGGATGAAASVEVGDVVLGKYRIEGLLGEGGMCLVYVAYHLQLAEKVALKVLRPELASDASVVARFMREGQTAIRIRSEHVVRVFDTGLLPSGTPYMVLEHLDGQDLDALLEQNGPVVYAHAVDYLLQAGEAIAEAHGLGMVHRDLKPANLFLTRRADGTPWIKVLDFGISKIAPRLSVVNDRVITGTAIAMGSPQYMSPEQMRSARDVDQRADLWAIGAVLYELLSGHAPFESSNVPEVCAMILSGSPPNLGDRCPDLPEGLVAAVHRCLEKNPNDRYPTMAALAIALEPYATTSGKASAARICRILSFGAGLEEEGGVLTTTGSASAWGSTNPSWRPPKRRSPVTVVLAALALVGVGVLGTAAALKKGPFPLDGGNAETHVQAPAAFAGAPTMVPTADPTAAPLPGPAADASTLDAGPFTDAGIPESTHPERVADLLPDPPEAATERTNARGRTAPGAASRPAPPSAAVHRRRSGPSASTTSPASVLPTFPPPTASSDATPVVESKPTAPPPGDSLFDDRK